MEVPTRGANSSENKRPETVTAAHSIDTGTISDATARDPHRIRACMADRSVTSLWFR